MTGEPTAPVAAMTLDQLREAAFNNDVSGVTPQLALAFIEYVHANQKATVRLFGSMAEARAFNASEDRLFSLLGEQP